MKDQINRTASQQLHDLFDLDWERRLIDNPELATYLGDSRYNGRLTDLSPEAIATRKAHQREMLDRIRAIDRSQLDAQDAISYDLFLYDKEIEVESQRFPVELLAISQMDGPQIGFGQLAASTSFENVGDYENYIERLHAFPRYLDEITALLRRGMECGWVPPAVPLRAVPAQIDGQIFGDPAKSPLSAPFYRFPHNVRQTDRSLLNNAGLQAIRQGVMLALSKLSAFMKETYLPACRESISAGSVKDGADYYRFSVRRQTTTNLEPEEIHEIGRREVARVHRQMESVIREVGFQGTFGDFLKFLRFDPRFYYSNAKDLVDGYAAITKRIDAELPRLFAELPRTPYGVREIPAYEAPAQTTAYYMPGAADGSRSGYFYVNTHKLETRPRYEMEALSLHEAVPGHHLQIARAQELHDLPQFRRNASYTAYVEGWGLYAESLGNDIQFYSDAYSKFGQYTYEMWRACRLVIDTGIHAMGWTRRQAIDYMMENAAKTENDVTVEVDRYIVWPAQALAYKIGELKIQELRRRAEAALGETFDIRRFHNAILDNGPLPLNILESQIGSWIENQVRVRKTEA